MERDNLIWLAIRLIGIYLIICGAFGLPRLVNTTWQLHSYWSWNQFHKERLSYFTPEIEALSGKSDRAIFAVSNTSFILKMSEAITEIFNFILALGAGIYCLRKGSFLRELISEGNPLLKMER